MLTVEFGESTMSRTQVQLWYNRLKEGREDVNEDARSVARAREQSMKILKKLILDNRRIIIEEISDDVGIWFDSCHSIFTDILVMKLAAAKIVPKLLNFDRKQRYKQNL